MTREENFIDFFSELNENNLSRLNEIFAVDARFKDPFNDVVGNDGISAVFKHMFKTTEFPKFTINHHAVNDNKLFLQWVFSFEKKKKKWNIDGSSIITFNRDNLVIEHLDYWDPAEQIYSKVGVLKPLMNFLRTKLSAH